MAPRRRDEPIGPTAAVRVADAVRSSILAGEVEPGSPLREEQLTRAHGVSRHTVRAALAELAGERLVEIAPHRGARVALLDDEAVLALQQLRVALEAEAVRLIREEHGTVWPDALLAPILAAVEDLAAAESSDDWTSTIRAHAAVHRTLVAAASNPRITEAYTRLESEILLLLSYVRPDYPAGSLGVEHREYVAEVARAGGDAVRAHFAHSTDLLRAARSSVAATDSP